MKTNHCYSGTAAVGKSATPRAGTSLLLLAAALALGAGLAGALLLVHAAREAGAQTATNVEALGWMRDDWGQTTIPEAAKSGVKAVAAGNIHSIALKEDGSVVAWGHNRWGQTTVPEAARSGVKAISAGGGYHSLALKEDGSVVAWGKNDYGETTVPEVARSGVKAISAGEYHNLAVKEDGSVIAWGRDQYGATIVPEAAKSGVKAVAAGGTHSLALKEDGSVVAWGENDYRQATVPEAARSGVKAISAGGSHCLALKEDGSVVAWGNSGLDRTNIPEKAKSGVKAIAAGWSHSLALREDGSVVTWGYGNIGTWGGHLLNDSDVPSQARTGVTAVAAGFDFSLAAKETDTTPPATVGSFTAAADPAGGRVKLSWTNPTDVDFTFVRILRSTARYAGYGPQPSADDTQSVVYEGAAQSFTDTNVTDKTTYFYTAYAYDGRNWSAWNTVNATPFDQTPPDTVLGNGGPSGAVGSTSAAFEFTSTEAGSTFECSLNGGSFETCESGKVYENLDDGPHAFDVRAVDAGRNADNSPARREWTVDTGPPDTTMAPGPSGITNNTTAAFALSSTERSSTFECRLDDASFEPCGPEKTYRGLGDGFHVFEARAVDAAGTADPSPVRRTWSVDTAVPNTGITEGPSGTVRGASATFEFLASEPGATFECSLDGGDFAACDSPEELTGLSDGSHEFRVRATDAAGNADATPAGRTWTVDATVPGEPEITSPANGSSDTDGSFVVRGTAERGSMVRLYEGATRVGTDEADPGSGAWRIALADVPDDEHTYTATATDAAGNTSAASGAVRVTVDSTKPAAPAITSPANNAYDLDGSFALRGTAEKGAKVSLFEGKTLKGTATASAATGAWRIDLTGVADGRHSYGARATDAAGNDSTRSAPRTVTVDRAAPSVLRVDPKSGAKSVAHRANVIVTFSEAMRPATVSEATVKLVRNGKVVPAKVTYDARAKRATLNPGARLVAGATYKAVVSTGARDAAGNPLSAAKVWRFSVEP